VTGGWRKYHNGELYNFYTVPNKRMIGWVGHAAYIESWWEMLTHFRSDSQYRREHVQHRHNM